VSCGHGGICVSCVRAGIRGGRAARGHRSRARMENRKSAFSCLSRGPVSCRLVSLPPGACVCVVGTIVDGREVSRFVADQSGCQAPVRTQVRCGDRSVLIRSTTVTRCSLVQCTVCSLVVGRLSSVWRDRYGGTYQLLALALTFSHLHTLPWIMRKRGWPFGIIVI
jgi:hypothetical protein